MVNGIIASVHDTPNCTVYLLTAPKGDKTGRQCKNADCPPLGASVLKMYSERILRSLLGFNGESPISALSPYYSKRH